MPARCERDEWTMVGYLPQESEAVGDETVMDVATGRAGGIAARWKSGCTSWRKPATWSRPNISRRTPSTRR